MTRLLSEWRIYLICVSVYFCIRTATRLVASIDTITDAVTEVSRVDATPVCVRAGAEIRRTIGDLPYLPTTTYLMNIRQTSTSPYWHIVILAFVHSWQVEKTSSGPGGSVVVDLVSLSVVADSMAPRRLHGETTYRLVSPEEQSWNLWQSANSP